jgi:hypothetical protein
LSLDEGTWARGRGWALWKALITMVRDRDTGADAGDAAHRFGWRWSPWEVVEKVLADRAMSSQIAVDRLMQR